MISLNRPIQTLIIIFGSVLISSCDGGLNKEQSFEVGYCVTQLSNYPTNRRAVILHAAIREHADERGFIASGVEDGLSQAVDEIIKNGNSLSAQNLIEDCDDILNW